MRFSVRFASFGKGSSVLLAAVLATTWASLSGAWENQDDLKLKKDKTPPAAKKPLFSPAPAPTTPAEKKATEKKALLPCYSI